MSVSPEGLSKADIQLARSMWAKGVSSEKNSSRLFISDTAFTKYRSRNRELFPSRGHGGGRLIVVTEQRKPRSDVSRYKRVFLPLPSCPPVPFATATGCSWPVYEEPLNPLDSPVATHVCGQPQLMRGDRKESYCAVHYRVAYTPRAA